MPDQIPASPGNPRQYRGRFAPSPTGPLHLGSIAAALAGFLDARAAGGKWLVRMEDLDPPREVPGAASDILHTLENIGLHWDESVIYQSQRAEAYRDALATLQKKHLCYRCCCSRLQLADLPIYPGTCRNQHFADTQEAAIRCVVPDREYGFSDRLQGNFRQQLSRDAGDFVVLRKDGWFAYQLAVVVDDGWQQITDVVRGRDLLDSTPRQIFLQQQLGLPELYYAHIPVIVSSDGQKLGKQQYARPVNANAATSVLWTALLHLQQSPDIQLQRESPAVILEWATRHWQPSRLKGMQQIKEQDQAD